MHVHVNMCMQYKTTLYISEINAKPLKDPFLLKHGERERERERERQRPSERDRKKDRQTESKGEKWSMVRETGNKKGGNEKSHTHK